MSEQNRKINLNLSINVTYYSLFKEDNSLKLLANLFLEDHPNATESKIVHDVVPDWKAELLESLHALLKTEEEGRLFGEQLIRNYSEDYELSDFKVAKQFVSLTFQPQ